MAPFLPGSVPTLGQLGWFALLLLVAVALGEVARLLRLPRLLGYVAAGIVLGPYGSGLMRWATTYELGILVDVALGVLLFELGHWLDLSWLRRNPWLLATSLLEAVLAFFAVYGALLLAGVEGMHAVGAAAIGMSTSPAVVVQITRELRAQGQVTERLKLLTALNSAYAVIAITVWISWLHLEYEGSTLTAVLHPIYLVIGSIVLAMVAAVFARIAPRWLRGHPSTALLLVLGLVLILIAGARALNLSPLLALLSFGVVVRRWVGWLRVLPAQFATVSAITAVMLFALIGANLNFGSLDEVAITMAAFVVARLVAKWVGAVLTSVPSGIPRRKGSLVGVALAPMSGLAVVLVQNVSGIYPTFPGDLMMIVVAAVAVLEIIGPVLTKVALVRARETRPD